MKPKKATVDEVQNALNILIDKKILEWGVPVPSGEKDTYFEVYNKKWKVSPLYFRLSDVNKKFNIKNPIEFRIVVAIYQDIERNRLQERKQVDNLFESIEKLLNTR